MVKLARELVRGSIIEDAATRFIAMCMAEAIENSLARQPNPHTIARAALEAAAKVADRPMLPCDVGGDLLLDPYTAETIADAIRALANDPAALAEIVKGTPNDH
jgi:hypothetical protein